MKKVRFKWLLLSFILSIASINAVYAGTKTIYFDANGKSFKDGATNFAVYLFGDGDEWQTLELVSGSIYSATVSDSKPNCIFCSMNSHTTGWSNKTGQTSDQSNYASSGNCFTVSKVEDNGDIKGTWSTYSGPAITYSVAYDHNGKTGGGSAPTDATAYDSGDQVTVAGNTGNMTKSGYVFAGWNTAANGSGTYYAPGATFSITADKRLYAMWIPTAVLGGTNVMAYCGELDSWGQDHYYFKNSDHSTTYSDVSISGTREVVGENYRTGVVTLAPSTTYYHQGHWDSNLECAIQAGYLYVVRGSKSSSYFTQKDYQQNGNDHNYLYEVSQQNGSTPATRSASTTLSPTIFEVGTSTMSVSTSGSNVPGYSVLGWSNNLLYFLYNGSSWSLVTLSTGNLDVSGLSVGSSYKLATVLFDGYIYVVADEDAFTVTASGMSVTYHGNGNTSGDAPVDASSPYAEGTDVTVLGAGTLARSNYDFSGWNTNANITGTTYAASGTIEDIDDDIDLYAIWTQNITLKPNTDNHGSGSDKSATAVYNKASLSSFTATSASTGYQVKGYYTAATSGTKVLNKDGTFAGSSVTSYITDGKWSRSSSTTLHAQLEAKKYDITLDRNGGTSDGSAKATYDAGTLSSKSNPSRANYEVLGYYQEAGCTHLIADASGTLQASTDYTDGSGNWKSDDNQRLYTKWGIAAPSSLYIDGTLSGSWNERKSMTKSSRTFTYTIFGKASGTYEFCFKNSGGTEMLKPNMSICSSTTNIGNISWSNTGNPNYNFSVSIPSAGDVTVVVSYPEGELQAWVAVYHTPSSTSASGWYMIGDPFYKADSKSWSATENTDYPLNQVYRGISGVYYRYADLGSGTTYFKLSDGSTQKGPNKFDDNQTISKDTQYPIVTNTSQAFKSNNSGKVLCVFDKNNTKFWIQNQVMYYTITLSNGGSGDVLDGTKGTIALTEGTYGGLATKQYKAGETVNVSITAKSGYYIDDISFGGESVETDYNAGSYSGTLTMPTGNATLTVTYVALYTLNYAIGSVTGTAGSITSSPETSSGSTVLDASIITLTAPTEKTGYSWKGWYLNNDGSGVQQCSTKAYAITISGNTTVYACYSANNYTVTLDFDEEHKGTTTGATGSQSVTYDAATTTVPALPGAANGYCFMGYYTESDGGGVKLINDDGTWIASVDGYTDESKKWVHDGDVTLHAYYQIAEITEIAITGGAIVLNSTSTTVTATVSPEPEGTTTVCWEVQYSDGTPLPSQPTFTPANGRSVTFTSPARSGSYKLQATLITGSTCGSGETLDIRTYAFTVAGEHTVTIQYKCGDVTVQTSASVEGVKPQDWSDDITAPDDPFGYLFSKWVAGDGVTIKDPTGDGESTNRTIQIKANYDGILTAQYTKKDLIYFKNTMGWSGVYVYFYTSNRYWDGTEYGSGTWKDKEFCIVTGKDEYGNDVKDCTKPYWDQKHGALTRLGETDIWYFDFGAIGCADWHHVVFNANQQDSYQWFSATEVVRRGDLSKGTPMYVPADKSTYTPNTKNSTANYYSQGYWTNYLGDVTGYTLEIYNSAGNKLLKSVAFTGDENLMPMTAVVDLEAGQTYKYQIKRDYGYYYGNSGTMTYADHGQGTAWEFTNEPSFPGMCGLTTASAGDYTFHMTYSQNGSGVYNLRMSVDYPITSGDYRLIYSDDVQTKALVSAVLPKAKEENIASFFVRPAKHPVLKMQKCTGIDGATVTWTDTIADLLNDASLPAVMTKDTIYNVILTKGDNGTFSHTGTEYYSGNYYIRTDCAGSKWDNYTSDPRNRMTYSEYAAMTTHSDATRDFTHYFVSHANQNTNVKFVIATDYSPNITDTLKQQPNDITYSHVNTDGNIQEAANIRFMWNIRNNQIRRAYLANAKTDGTEYLVLQGQEGNLLDANGYPLSHDATEGTNGYNHQAPDNAIQFDDTENFMYEANVKAEPGGRVKLYTTFHAETYYQYGDNNASFDDPHAIELIGGTGDAQSIRVIYDFKTDRLIAAWVPSDETISDTKTINADIMLIREHQEAGKQINLSGLGKIETDKTVYGVMRFNRYILNNRSTEGEHPILDVSDQKSQYERFNYMISFPFDVKVGEVFGFGTRGNEWRISYYDALGRAQEGFFAERGDNNWRLISSPDSILHANVGYLLQLNYIRLGYNKTGAGEVWANNKEEVELYFPAKNKITSISVKNIDIPALSDDYKCTINLMDTYTGMGYDEEKASEADRRVKDSYWRCIGVPGFTSYEATASSWTNFNWTAEADSIPFIYEWQMDDNSLTVVSTTTPTFTFKSMHAYLLQNGKAFTWTGVAQPHNIVARRAMTADEMNLYEFRLEMQNNEEMLDQTYIRLSNSETVTEAFDFGEDLSKEMNSKYNIYTKVGYERLAANNLPLTEQTTIVPVGVKISTDGTYIFSIPEGTNGVGVILVDEFAGTRTNLALEDYEVNLTAGKIDDRFKLEISPVAQMPTDIELINSEKSETGVRKMLIDGILYIVRDGKIFDAQGKRVK